MYKLYISQRCPPYDNTYVCVSENYDGAPDADEQIIGEGATPEEAKEDYYMQSAAQLHD